MLQDLIPRWLRRRKWYRQLVLTRHSEPSWMFLRDVSGVVHVGGNVGQERFLYSRLGLDVIWIEPIPEVFETLCRNIQGMAGQRALMALVTDIDGQAYDFKVASNNGMSSSILMMKQHLDVWPDIAYVSNVELKSVTLTSLMRDIGMRWEGGAQALVIDTQGAELLVLQGSISLLKNFNFVKVEAADFESYEGGCQLSDIARFMAQQGYEEVLRLKFAEREQGGAYFDVVYRRCGQR